MGRRKHESRDVD